MKKKPGPKVSKDGKKICMSITLHRSVIKLLRKLAEEENISASSWIEKAILNTKEEKIYLTNEEER